MIALFIYQRSRQLRIAEISDTCPFFLPPISPFCQPRNYSYLCQYYTPIQMNDNKFFPNMIRRKKPIFWYYHLVVDIPICLQTIGRPHRIRKHLTMCRTNLIRCIVWTNYNFLLKWPLQSQWKADFKIAINLIIFHWTFLS